MRGSASGGTMATVFHSLGTERYKPALKYDPLVKTVDDTKSTSSTRANNTGMLGYSSEIKQWIGISPMASVMANSVKRVNGVLGLGEKATYSVSALAANLLLILA